MLERHTYLHFLVLNFNTHMFDPRTSKLYSHLLEMDSVIFIT